MPNNCLVTKLKSVVDNNNLPFLDSITLVYKQRESPSNASQYLAISAVNGNVEIKVLDGGYLTSTYGGESIGTTYTVDKDSLASLWVSNADCRVIIKNKQNILAIDAVGVGEPVDIDYLLNTTTCRANINAGYPLHLNSIESISAGLYSVGDVKNIPSVGLKQLNLTYSADANLGIACYLEDLAANTTLNRLSISVGSDSLSRDRKCTGNISNLSNKPISYFNVDKCLSINGDFEALAPSLILHVASKGNTNGVHYQISNSKIGGSIQAFVNACVDGGVTSGSIKMPWIKTNSYIYSDAEHTTLVKNNPNIVNNANAYLTWSSDKTWSIAAQ